MRPGAVPVKWEGRFASTMIHSAIHSRTQKSARTPVALKIQVWWVKANPCHNAWGQLTGPASLDFFELCQRNLLTQKKLCEYSRKHQGGVRSAQWLHHKIHSKQPYNMCFEILVLPVPCRRLGGSSLMPEHAVSPHFSDIVLTSLEPPSSILELLYLQGYL